MPIARPSWTGPPPSDYRGILSDSRRDVNPRAPPPSLAGIPSLAEVVIGWPLVSAGRESKRRQGAHGQTLTRESEGEQGSVPAPEQDSVQDAGAASPPGPLIAGGSERKRKRNGISYPLRAVLPGLSVGRVLTWREYKSRPRQCLKVPAIRGGSEADQGIWKSDLILLLS